MRAKNCSILPSRTVDEIIAVHQGKPGSVLSILENVQKRHPHNYLPRETLEYIAAKLNIAPAQIYGAATFYSFFNLKPQGEHTLTVCRGTACHTRGSKELHENLKHLLGAQEIPEEGESAALTTADNRFTVRTVACFGQCALAPVLEIDGVIHGHVTREKLRKLILSIKRKKKK